MDTSIKAFCPKCFMTFESGKFSSRAVKHVQLSNCNKVSCSRKGSGCIRKFSSINSANRHTYCYTEEQVSKWDSNWKISPELNFEFENLKIHDADELAGEELMFPEYIAEGPPYKYGNEMLVGELFEILERKMGKEFPAEKIAKVRSEFVKAGYVSAGVIRDVKEEKGSWEFIYREFKQLGWHLNGLVHILKKILCKKARLVNRN